MDKNSLMFPKRTLPMNEQTISFSVTEFKKYLFDVIRSSYTLGVAYVSNPPTFTMDEAIKRFQETHWEDLKDVWGITDNEQSTH